MTAPIDPLRTLLLPLALSCACAPRSDPPDKIVSTSSESGGPAKVDDSGDASSASAADSSGGAAACDNPAFTCVPEPCGAEQGCGPLEAFATDGCLRLACTDDDDCAADERCYRPGDFGECSGSVTTECMDAPGGCLCTVTSGVPAYCVAADDYPDATPMPCAPLDCGAPGSNSHVDAGNCVCDPGYQWCAPDDPDDFSCCEI